MCNAMRYRVEFEENDEVGYSAYLPELPGCVAAGETFEETKELIAEAVELRPELMEEEGLPIPEPAPSKNLFRCNAGPRHKVYTAQRIARRSIPCDLLKNPLVRKAPKFFRRIPYELAPALNNSGHAIVCHGEYRQRGSDILVS